MGHKLTQRPEEDSDRLARTITSLKDHVSSSKLIDSKSRKSLIARLTETKEKIHTAKTHLRLPPEIYRGWIDLLAAEDGNLWHKTLAPQQADRLNNLLLDIQNEANLYIARHDKLNASRP